MFSRGAFTKAQHLAKGCFRTGTMSTRHENEFDRLLKMIMTMTKMTCGTGLWVTRLAVVRDRLTTSRTVGLAA